MRFRIFPFKPIKDPETEEDCDIIPKIKESDLGMMAVSFAIIETEHPKDLEGDQFQETEREDQNPLGGIDKRNLDAAESLKVVEAIVYHPWAKPDEEEKGE